MIWVCILIEEYYLTYMYLNTTIEIQRQKLSFFILILLVMIGLKALFITYRAFISVIKFCSIFIEFAFTNDSDGIKIPYDNKTIEESWIEVRNSLKKLNFYGILFIIGNIVPCLLPLDSGGYEIRLIKNIFNSELVMDIVIFYCFLTVYAIFSEISRYLVIDAYLYLGIDMYFGLDYIPFMYKKFYDYYSDEGCDTHEALKKAAVFKISMKLLPLIGLIISYIVYKYVC